MRQGMGHMQNQPGGHRDDGLRGRTLDLLRVLDRIAREKKVDLREYRADLIKVREQLRRRPKDAQARRFLNHDIARLTEALKRRLPKPGLRRRVRVIKISGRGNAKILSRSPIVGWEETPPIVGKRYRVFKKESMVFSTSLVTKIAAGYFRTRNSVYRLEVLEKRRG
jgi:hypothetical protein